jgi:hypothetical protein
MDSCIRGLPLSLSEVVVILQQDARRKNLSKLSAGKVLPVIRAPLVKRKKRLLLIIHYRSAIL